MKRFLFLLPVVVLFVSCAGPRQQHVVAPSFRPVTESVSKLSENNKASTTHAQKAKKAIESAETAESPKTLKLALDSAKNEVDALTKILLDDAAEIQKLEQQVKVVAAEADIQTVIANKAIDDNGVLTAANLKLAAQAKVDRDHVHKLKFWLCGTGAAIGGLALFQFGGSLIAFFGPWGLLAYVAVPGAIYAFLWRFL